MSGGLRVPHSYETGRVIKLRDGRLVSVEPSGDERGLPVFLHHGTPGSGKGPKPRDGVLYRLGVNLISYSRPGYGRSTRSPGRTVADAAHDLAAIADHLGLDRFAVVGRSGGGPHALACAALLPDRVIRAAVLVSVAPADAIGLDWYGHMVDSNVSAYRAADADERRLTEQLRLRADRVRSDPSHLIEQLRREMTAADLRIIDDVAIRDLLLRTYREALVDGPYGWIDDVLALRGDWGFRPERIRVPVRLWHGADDQFAPVSHTRWLADQIPTAILEVQHGVAHFGALQVLPRLLGWLVAAPDEALSQPA
jgi:pimeloyl-ACP methyl ester carboxylesterase